jgi:hypothetical protein
MTGIYAFDTEIVLGKEAQRYMSVGRVSSGQGHYATVTAVLSPKLCGKGVA